MANSIQIIMNTDVYPPLKKGQIVRVDADEEGTPFDQTWRRRLSDTGNPCSMVTPKKRKVKSKGE